MISDREWKTIEGKRVDDLLETFKSLLSQGQKVVHIGTDSQQKNQVTEYVTVLVVLEEGKGGRAFFTRERVPRIKNLGERLMKEVWMSVTAGMELTPHISADTQFTIHIDANPNVKFKSSKYVKELSALVVSQGFSYLLKPESWAASHTADHVVKGKAAA